MTKHLTLEGLAKRCEDASGPDEQLDQMIHDATHRQPSRFHTEFVEVPRYTGSMDMAMKLIPLDHDYILEHTNGGLTISARVGDKNRMSWGSTMPLAICAACLRALDALTVKLPGN